VSDHQDDHDEHDHDGHEHDGHDHEGHEHDDELDRENAEKLLRRQIALSQVRQYGDPALRMRAQEVERYDDELKALAERMLALMHEAEGIGLAATQVGIVRRFFVCTLEGEDRAIANPRIAKAGAKTETDDEGCLSLGDVRVPVDRPTEVTLEGFDLDGNPIRFDLEGIQARVVQHELDHLDGTLTIDRTDPESRRDALRRLRPKLALR